MPDGSFIWYNIYREDVTPGQDVTPYFVFWAAGVGVTSYLDTNAQQWHQYVYYVTAQIGEGLQGAASDLTAPVAVLPNAAPAPPAALSGTVVQVAGGAEADSLWWTPSPGATSYNIYGSQTPGSPQVLLLANYTFETWSSTGYRPLRGDRGCGRRRERCVLPAAYVG